ncbi:hypothetical protein A9Q81_10385 [Gammaproteobacteria bacterium 42_54_T18]|nr:hypothetical protein A9Q81_10385 [Gammaproteobacteria bacterium 42_54_T18]
MKKCALSLPVLLFTLLNPTPLLANEHLDYLFGLSLEELLKVKITGSTLTPKELKFVPSTVSVFAHKEIINLGLDTLDEPGARLPIVSIINILNALSILFPRPSGTNHFDKALNSVLLHRHRARCFSFHA